MHIDPTSGRARAVVSVFVSLMACGRGASHDGARRDAASADRPVPQDAAPLVDHLPDVDWGPGVPVVTAPSGPLPGTFVVVSSDGKQVASVEGGRHLRIRDAATLAIVATVPLCLAGRGATRSISECPDQRYPRVVELAFSPDGAALAVACVDCAPGASLHVVEIPTGRLRFATALATEPRCAAWGASIAVGLDDALLLLDPATGAQRQLVAGFARRLATDASAYLTGTTIVSLVDGSVHDTRAGQDTVIPLPAQRGYVVVDNYAARRFGPRGEERGDLFSHAGSSGAVATEDGRYVVALEHDYRGGRLHLIDLDAERLLLEDKLEDGANLYAGGFAVGPGGAIYVPSATEGVRRVTRAPVAVLLVVSTSGTRLLAVEEAPDGGYVAVLRETSTAMAAIETLGSFEAVGAAAFSPNGRRVAIGEGSSVVIAPGAAPPIALDFEVQEVAWGPDRLIASGNGQLVMIDPQTREVRPIAADLLEGIAPDAATYCVRAQGKRWEKPMPGGGHSWGQDPSSIDCVSIASRKRRTVVPETQGDLFPLEDGAALVVDGSYHDLLNAAGKTRTHLTHEFMNVVALATSDDGRWVAQVDGNYGVVLFDMQAEKIVWRESPSTKPTALAVTREGVVFVGQEGGGTLRFEP